jgi:hypothetical protein
MTLWSSKDEEFWTTWIHKLDSDDLFFRHNLTFLGEVFQIFFTVLLFLL